MRDRLFLTGVVRSVLGTAAFATIAGFLLMKTPALAQQDNSGNYMLPFCQAFLRMESYDVATVTNEIQTAKDSSGGSASYMMKVGICAGEAAGIAEMLNAGDHGPKACIPNGVTKVQLVRVVVAAAEKTPAQLHEDFGTLAAIAFITAWPCNK